MIPVKFESAIVTSEVVLGEGLKAGGTGAGSWTVKEETGYSDRVRKLNRFAYEKKVANWKIPN